MSGRSTVKSRGGARSMSAAHQAIKSTRAQMRRVQYASSRSTARRAPSVVSRGGTEIKQIDTELSPAAVPAQGTNSLVFTPAGSLSCVNLIRAGTGFFNRVGRKVALRAIRVKFTLADEMPVSTETLASHLRVLVIYDAAPNASLPAIQDILCDYGQDGVPSTSWLSGLNPVNRDRFKILRDIQSERPEIYNDANGVRTSSGVVDQLHGIEWFDEYIKQCRGWEVCFKSDSSPSTIADIVTGAVYILTISETDLSGRVNIRGKVRTTYSDA